MDVAVRFAAATATFIALLTIAEISTRRWGLHPEHGRKLAHVSSGIAAAALPLVLPFPAIAALAALFIPFLLISRKLDLFTTLHRAERSTFGEIYFPAGVLGAALLVPSALEYSFGVLVMGLGDAAAGLFGKRFGRRSYRVWSSEKTYLGSSVMFVVTAGLCFAALGLMGRPSAWIPLAIASIVTLEEAVTGAGADNAVLPASAAALLRILA